MYKILDCFAPPAMTDSIVFTSLRAAGEATDVASKCRAELVRAMPSRKEENGVNPAKKQAMNFRNQITL